MPRLQGKTALITGGTSGIGLETARRFLEEGARVAITGRNPAHIHAARQTLGGDVLVIAEDAGDIAAQPRIAAGLETAFGRLDAVFANAGVVDLRPIGNWDEAAFDRTINIDVKGPYFLIQALLPLLANPASIILSGSVNAHMGMVNTHVYSLAKAGMISLARTLSGELIGAESAPMWSVPVRSTRRSTTTSASARKRRQRARKRSWASSPPGASPLRARSPTPSCSSPRTNVRSWSGRRCSSMAA